MKKMLSQSYIDKIGGGVYGKIIGIRLGIPFEGHHSASLLARLPRIDTYPLKTDLTMPDDDNNGFVFFAKVFDMIERPEDLTPEHAAYIILNAAWEDRGFFWWDRSTEQQGYHDLLHGAPIPAPGEGSDAVGGQIFYDAAGLVFAGQPEQAARCAETLSRVLHAGEGRIGAMFLCACIARAFDSDDPVDIVETGLRCIPQDTAYARMVRRVLRFYLRYPHDWRICQRMLEDSYDDWSACGCASHIVMALLYGCGVFSYSMEICLLSGGDTDCNCGDLGTILGAMLGWQGIAKDRWLDPINDSFFCSSALPYENDVSVTETAASLIRACARFRGETLPDHLARRPETGSLRFLFPFSYQGFSLYDRTTYQKDKTSEVGRQNMLVCTDPHILPTPSGCPNVLKLWIDHAKAGHAYRLYRFSSDGVYYRKRRVTEAPDPDRPRYPHLTKYEPTCCTRFLPGQRVELSLFTKYDTCDMEISLVAGSSLCGKRIRSAPITLQEWRWTKMSWTIPDIDGFMPDRLELEIVPQKDTYFRDGYDGLDLYIDEIQILGMPNIRFTPKPQMLDLSKHYPILANWSVGIGEAYLGAEDALRFYAGRPDPIAANQQYHELAFKKRMSAALFGRPLRDVRIRCKMRIAPPDGTVKERGWRMDRDGSSMMIVAARGAADHYAVGYHQGQVGIFRCTGLPGRYCAVDARRCCVDPEAPFFITAAIHGTQMHVQIVQRAVTAELAAEADDLEGYMGFVSIKNGVTVYGFDIAPYQDD